MPPACFKVCSQRSSRKTGWIVRFIWERWTLAISWKCSILKGLKGFTVIKLTLSTWPFPYSLGHGTAFTLKPNKAGNVCGESSWSTRPITSLFYHLLRPALCFMVTVSTSLFPWTVKFWKQDCGLATFVFPTALSLPLNDWPQTLTAALKGQEAWTEKPESWDGDF